MDLQEKFEKGAKSKTYQRIDADFKVNIFVGYNEDGCMSMVITENGVESHVKSTKLINVKMQRREDKKLALYFDLLDEAYKSMFLILCKDIVLTCEKAGPELAISNALMRWKYWKEMFGRKNNVLLDKSEIKGLGEVTVSAIEEFKELKNRGEFISKQKIDLEESVELDDEYVTLNIDFDYDINVTVGEFDKDKILNKDDKLLQDDLIEFSNVLNENKVYAAYQMYQSIFSVVSNLLTKI